MIGKKYDIVALGEMLIDFTPSGEGIHNIPLYGCNPGGAPANVLAMYAKLGGHAAFLGKVGEDVFGDFLCQSMKAAGIDTCGVRRSAKYPTTLAFVHIDGQGDRSFSFYRQAGADTMLCVDEVDRTIVEDCMVFHLGSVSLTNEPCRSATLYAVRQAMSAGALISYDPNYRPLLWQNQQVALDEMRSILPLADLIKVSEEEMILLTGETNLQEGAVTLARYGATLIVITRGADGAYFYTAEACGEVEAFPVEVADTTGAGDAFWGALLFVLRGRSKEQLRTMTEGEWRKAVKFANAAGGLTASGKGAIPSMPCREQIMQLLEGLV